MSSLTRAEKNAIIINDAKGIQHPDYYVCHTKTGGIQVRKRKVPLTTTELKAINEPEVKEVVKTETKEEVKSEVKEEVKSETKPEIKNIEYEMISNKQLLEKMLAILEKNSESKDKNLNDPERERETKENKEFIEGIKEENKVLSAKRETHIETPSKPQDNNQKSETKRQIIKPTQHIKPRKGRNLLH